jgi:uncharacterized protein YegP (UPF0339 family)
MFRHICAWVALAALSLSAVACTAEASQGVNEDDETTITENRGASFETNESADGQFTFDLVASNGHPLMHSVAFATKEEAEQGIQTAITIGSDARRYETASTVDGFAFTLKTPAGAPLATSDCYSTKAGAERGARTARALVREIREALRPATPTSEL